MFLLARQLWRMGTGLASQCWPIGRPARQPWANASPAARTNTGPRLPCRSDRTLPGWPYVANPHLADSLCSLLGEDQISVWPTAASRLAAVYPARRGVGVPGKRCGAVEASSQQPGLFSMAPDIGGPRCPLGSFLEAWKIPDGSGYRRSPAPFRRGHSRWLRILEIPGAPLVFCSGVQARPGSSRKPGLS